MTNTSGYECLYEMICC